MSDEDDHVMKVRGRLTHDLSPSYAFVTYNNKDSASEATEALNGATILGQQIKVNVARPKNDGGGGGGEVVAVDALLPGAGDPDHLNLCVPPLSAPGLQHSDHIPGYNEVRF